MKIMKSIKKWLFQHKMSKNANFEPPYKCFFKEIPMFGFTRKKYHYGTTFIHQKIQKSEIKVFQLNSQDVPTVRRLRFKKKELISLHEKEWSKIVFKNIQTIDYLGGYNVKKHIDIMS